MIEELDSLKEKYPQFFPEHFFFECDNGWYNILSSLLYRINMHEKHVRQENAYRVRHGRDPVEYRKVKIIQVKSKFGTLRFYIDGGDEYVRGAIAVAEDLTSKTCEDCGMPGKIYTDGWWVVQCPACREKSKPAST